MRDCTCLLLTIECRLNHVGAQVSVSAGCHAQAHPPLLSWAYMVSNLCGDP